MRKRFIAIALLLSAGVIFSAYKANTEDTKNELLIQLIVQSLNANHYDPYEVNDDFSERVYSLYLERLDYNKRFLTQADVKQLDSYQRSIDDQVLASNYEFFDLSADLFEMRMEKVKSYYKEILLQPFDFTVDEEINLDNEELEWAKNEAELRERWRKLLKYQVLSRIVTKMEVQESGEMEEGEEPMTFTELEEDAREKVMKTYKEWERRMGQQDRNDYRAIYFNAIANTYDPHTSYFPPKDKANFDIQMSGRLEGIGASLQEEEGYIKVVSIVPGSPSYRQGELDEGDIILKVAQGSVDPVDIVDMPLDDAVQLIRGAKGTEVRLTVKKVDGSITIIPIIRDVVVLAETYAKSAIIKNDHTKQQPVGYIKLPKFYADFQNKGGRRCATDVAEELVKLKEQNIKGLVIDLRNNGGGSLMDVVEMMGLFIPNGPVVQIKSRYGQPQLLYDRDKEVQYDGPLVVLVNSSSASASEILAAAVQDYKRGIVAGTPTFGKGTVQRFYSLDNLIGGNPDGVKPLGDIKLTTQKFYRVNGDATQLKGVTPDVILPDAYTFIDRGEREQDYAMPWDEIEAATYSPWTIGPELYSKVRRNSRERLKASETFGLVTENAQRLKRQRDMDIRSLNLETYRANEKKFKEEAKKYDNIQSPFEGTSLVNLPADVVKIGSDTVLQKINDEWFERLQKDIYINEATALLGDVM